MNYLINNQQQRQYLVTNNGVPTIFQLVSTNEPTRAKMEITIAGNTTIANQYITINDVTITSTPILANAKNNVFYVSQSTSYAENRLKAYYLVQAMNSTALANQYNIYVDQTYVSTTQAKVILEAKAVGSAGNITTFNTNLESAYWKFNTINSTSGDELADSKITLDLYVDNTDNQATIKNATAQTPTTHIVQLEKYFNYNEGGVSFDLSPILKTLTPEDNTAQYRLIVSALKNNTYRKLYDISGLHCLNGYQVNQGKDYFKCNSGTTLYLLQNVERGADEITMNNTTLYFLPAKKFYVSLLTLDKSRIQYKLKYLDSALNTIYETVTMSAYPQKNIIDIEIDPSSYNAHYLEVVITNLGTLRYKAINPVTYADNKDIQNVYWRNSYGGISNFIFTGKREEERDIEKTTYKISNLKYYSNTAPVQEKVLSTTPRYNVTLTSHLIDADARYQVYDLLNARKVWTIVNGKEYQIIIDNFSQTEVQRDIYEITITYHYSSSLV